MESRPPARNPFQVLGVDVRATEAEIKKAFRRLAKEYHPDQNRDDPELEERFKELSNAYETILSMSRGGATKDAAGYAQDGKRADGGLGARLYGFWRSGAQKEGERPSRGGDIEVEASVSFRESITGTIVRLQYHAQVACQRCGGDGARGETAFAVCPKCQGSGQVLEGDGGFLRPVFCQRCYGGGSVIRVACRKCRGGGRVRGLREVRIKIPPGVEDKTSFFVKGRGHAGARNWPCGDLTVAVSVRPHPVFTRKGMDIHSDARIPFTVAALGGEFEAITIGGKVRVKAPPETRSHTLLRLKGRGVNGEGDHYLRVIVEIPTRLTEKEKKLLRSFAHLHEDGGGKGAGGLFSFFRKT